MKVLKLILFFSILIGITIVTAGKRDKRWLIFTPTTQYGVLVALAVPLESMSKLSYGTYFEGNFYVVDNTSYWDPGVLQGSEIRITRSVKVGDFFSSEDTFTRRKLYNILEDSLQRIGGRGRQCLLRAICENSENHFHHNGLLGNIIHILLTPSSSKEEEQISNEYYEAELRGQIEDCSLYRKLCKYSLLETISIVLS